MRHTNSLNEQALKDARAVAKSNDAATAESLALTREGLRITREANEVSQRAWLTVKSSTLAKPLAIGEAPTVIVQIVNSGRSPALKVLVSGAVFSRAKLRPEDMAEGAPPGRRPFSRMVIGPDTSTTVPMDSDEPITRQVQIDAIHAGLWRLYTKGFISYRDIFGKARKSRFCFRSDARTSPG
jgi:hypothetical protein